jgi:1,4-dihydroxy-2-naphthoate polyprenyltransferase
VNFSFIFGPMRLPFLVLVPVCVLLGTAAAAFSGSEIGWGQLILVFMGALAAHISVNALNEYDDYKTGLDFHTRRTPFSGGSGTLPENPQASGTALKTGLIALVVTLLIGLFFLILRGVWLLPPGILGVLAVVTYTKYLTKNKWLCLIAPGLGFGPCMVMGTAFALTGQYTWTAALASLVPFFLVSNLLLLNQFPDVEADRKVGRRHFPIVIGRERSARLYVWLLAATYGTVLVGYIFTLFPTESALTFLSLVLAIPTAMGVLRFYDQIPKLLRFMGLNVILVLLTPALLAIGLLFAA